MTCKSPLSNTQAPGISVVVEMPEDLWALGQHYLELHPELDVNLLMELAFSLYLASRCPVAAGTYAVRALKALSERGFDL